MYLPQFHQVSENDKWWGEGFTEWSAVKMAKPLFPGHEQPRVPQNDNYYNLLDKSTMMWQAELMHKYGIDGICIYHYYFKDGRKILEKPAENLLKWKDIDMPFCFSWANESWIRSWSRLRRAGDNAWFSNFDKKGTDDGDGVLLQQDYGDEKNWVNHFEYLYPFFDDKRYIKVEGCPVFVIYKPDTISCMKDMIVCWNKMARKHGMPGVYFISGSSDKYRQKGFSNVLAQEPQNTMKNLCVQKYHDHDVAFSVDYEEVCKKIVEQKVTEGECVGSFVGYDDSPRRGRSGSIVINRDPALFEYEMRAQIGKAQASGSPFVFINAWNEWGEGMYLEPDDRYGTAFLEAVRNAKQNPERIIVNDETKIKRLSEENTTLQSKVIRYQSYWETLDNLLLMVESDRTFRDCPVIKNNKNIAIYGIGMIGKHVVRKMLSEGINIVYLIDHNTEDNGLGIHTYSPDNDLPPADIVIVTVMYDFDSIVKVLSAKIDSCKIIALTDIL